MVYKIITKITGYFKKLHRSVGIKKIFKRHPLPHPTHLSTSATARMPPSCWTQWEGGSSSRSCRSSSPSQRWGRWAAMLCARMPPWWEWAAFCKVWLLVFSAQGARKTSDNAVHQKLRQAGRLLLCFHCLRQLLLMGGPASSGNHILSSVYGATTLLSEVILSCWV